MALSAAQSWPASVELGLRSEAGRRPVWHTNQQTEGMLPERNIDEIRAAPNLGHPIITDA